MSEHDTTARPVEAEAETAPVPTTPFPRFESISERFASERELERPRTESYGELWRRAMGRSRRA